MSSLPEGVRFRPALLVVDVQEDFCPPSGSLAVAGGREIAPLINDLLQCPFVVKIATRDYHPPDHVSFADQQAPPNDVPFESRVSICDPGNSGRTENIAVWPKHCVQGTQGVDILPEIDASKFDYIVDKGRDKAVETFSAFADVFGNKSSKAISVDLAKLLRDNNISHTYVVGIAGDYCVECTALDAKKEGFEVYVVEEAVRSVDPSPQGWGAAKSAMEEAGIRVVSMHGPDVKKVSSREE